MHIPTIQSQWEEEESTRKEHQSYPAPSAQSDKAGNLTMLPETKPFLQVAFFLSRAAKRCQSHRANDDRATEPQSCPALKVLPLPFPDKPIASTFCQGPSQDREVLSKIWLL